MIRLLALLAFLSSPLTAQELPALYDVYDVAADDVLNIRAEPSSASDIIGALTPDAKDVEVVRSQDGWALVNTGERAGWVFMRYLSAAAQQPSHGYPAQCYGTEPFWSLSNSNTMVFELAGNTPLTFAPTGGGTSAGMLGKSYALGKSDSTRLAAVITRVACNDGMSDRKFGLSVDLLITTETGTALYSGCCSLR